MSTAVITKRRFFTKGRRDAVFCSTPPFNRCSSPMTFSKTTQLWETRLWAFVATTRLACSTWRKRKVCSSEERPERVRRERRREMQRKVSLLQVEKTKLWCNAFVHVWCVFHVIFGISMTRKSKTRFLEWPSSISFRQLLSAGFLFTIHQITYLSKLRGIFFMNMRLICCNFLWYTGNIKNKILDNSLLTMKWSINFVETQSSNVTFGLDLFSNL